VTSFYPVMAQITNTLLGNYWKNIDSLVLSHVLDEADLFVPTTVNNDADFTAFISAAFPAYANSIITDIQARYPPVMSPNSNYTTERARLKALIGDSSFQCNVRYLSDAYAGKSYNLQYSVTPGLHATDLLPTFYDLNLDLNIFGGEVSYPLLPGFGSFAQGYQSYLVSHARTGDPNTYKKTFNIPIAIQWPKPDLSGDAINNILDANDFGFKITQDGETRKSVCGFWEDVAAGVTELGGYAPPGSVVTSSLVGTPGNPSANYTD